MTSELFIENYRLDISSDISSLITFELDNVRDFSARGTSWSKTIVLPGTANNNKLFGHIFQIGQSNAYDSTVNNVGFNFNASVSARCLIFQDQFQTFKGVLRLMQINITKGKPEYEIAVFGELAGLNVSLSTGKLEDLDFSAYDHAFSVANIIASWDNPGGSGYYYPIIDYGQVSADKHSWDIGAFRPALYVKEYIDKMFSVAGYRYSSALFDTSRFKSLIIPHNSKNFKRPSTFKLNVSDTNQHYLDSDGTQWPVEFPSHGTVSDFTFDINSEVWTWVGAAPFSGTIRFSSSGAFTKSMTGAHEVQLLINGSIVDLGHIGGGSTSGFYSVSVEFTGNLNSGDFIQVFITQPVGGGTWDLQLFPLLTAASINDSLVDISIGDQVPINDQIPKNIRQIEFLVSIVKLFNLYVYEDRFDSRLIYITPYIDFYSTSQLDAVDWTYKMNRDKAIQIKPMSELNAKKYEFKYRPDNDYWNELYRKRYGEGYGDYVFDSAYEFSEQTKSLELIFAATPLLGYLGEEKLISTIYKKSNEIEERQDSVIRILQSKKVTGVVSWDILDGVSILTSTTDYGYAGHLNDPDVPGNDLNFGVLRELFFTLAAGDLTATQFNVYWSSYMAEITNKDSKLVSAWFYLKPKDILELDFSKKIFIDGVLFRLNSMKDYNATKPSDCNVELLKVNYLIY